jgi:hypothetical protein
VPLVADPIWRFDALQQKVVLVGLQPVAQLVSGARKLGGADPDQLEKIGLLMQLYGWLPQQTTVMAQYIAAVRQRMEKVREEGWQLDVSVLTSKAAA